MPFKSKAQAKWMFANHPKMAKEWAEKTNFKKLPKRKPPKRVKQTNQTTKRIKKAKK